MQTTISSESRQAEGRQAWKEQQGQGQQGQNQNISESVTRAFSHACEAQRSLAESAYESVEQVRPLLQESLNYMQRLQSAFSNYILETGNILCEQGQRTLGHVNEVVQAGSNGARQAVEQAQRTVEKGTDRPQQAQTAAAAGSQRGSQRETVTAGEAEKRG